MKYKEIALRELLDHMVWGASAGRGYCESDVNRKAEEPLSESQHRKVRELMMKECIRFRDELVRKGIVLDGVPLPGELDLAERVPKPRKGRAA